MRYALRRACRYHLRHTFAAQGYRPGQSAAVEALLSGRDLMCILPTGAGKSLCWQLPAVVHDGLTLVVSPLIALMRDQVQQLEKKGVPAVSLDSAMTEDERREGLRRIRTGEARILFVSPERLEQTAFCRLCRELRPWLIVVDEAHCIVQWGREFRQAYLHIGDFIRSLPVRPVVCALTATAAAKMQREIIQNLGMQRVRQVLLPHIRENLVYEVRTTLESADDILHMCIQEPCKTLVFCATRLETEWLSEMLLCHGVRAAHYHAGMERQQRNDVQEAYRRGEKDVLCATTAFGMGVDIPDIRRVIHAYLPGEVVDYAQQSGRAGRDGKPAQCILLFEPNDLIVRAGTEQRKVSKGVFGFSRWRYMHGFWQKQERLLRVLLTEECIPAGIAAAFGAKLAPCGKCSACRKGLKCKRIPHFTGMESWQLRRWFLHWQRDEMAKLRQCPARKIVSGHALTHAARRLVFRDEDAAPPEMERMLKHFRGDRTHQSGDARTD